MPNPTLTWCDNEMEMFTRLQSETCCICGCSDTKYVYIYLFIVINQCALYVRQSMLN